jgi:hypothetical protein
MPEDETTVPEDETTPDEKGNPEQEPEEGDGLTVLVSLNDHVEANRELLHEVVDVLANTKAQNVALRRAFAAAVGERGSDEPEPDHSENEGSGGGSSPEETPST